MSSSMSTATSRERSERSTRHKDRLARRRPARQHPGQRAAGLRRRGAGARQRGGCRHPHRPPVATGRRRHHQPDGRDRPRAVRRARPRCPAAPPREGSRPGCPAADPARGRSVHGGRILPRSRVSGFHDPRHHAVSLAFVVPVDGDCQPTQEALDLGWFTPAEAMTEQVRREMTGGHDRLIRLALAHVGQLP